MCIRDSSNSNATSNTIGGTTLSNSVVAITNPLALTSNTLTTPNTLSSLILSNAGTGASGSNFYNNSILFSVAGYGGAIGGGLQNNVGGFLSLGTMYGNAAIVPTVTIISANTTTAVMGIGQTQPQYILDVNNYNTNTQIRIGPRQYVGAAADTTTYGLERSRHEIRFAGYRDIQIDKIGSKIVSINKQTYGGGNQQLIQSADLAFFTVPPNTSNIDDTVERMRITDGGSVGIGTTSVAGGSNSLQVVGALTLGAGYRPLYSNVASGTSLSVSGVAYGTHFNITTSALSNISNGTITQSTDSNGYYVFRNNTGTYLSITFSYVTSGTTPPNPVVVPPANSVTMMYQYTGSTLSYVLF